MTQELSFVYDYGQVYLYDAAAAASVDFVAALDDAGRTGMSVGVAGPLVDLLLPLQWNFSARLLLETLEGEPPPDLDEWEHMVEFVLQLPSGRLLLEGSGGSGQLEIGLPPGIYHARWAGRGFPPPGVRARRVIGGHLSPAVVDRPLRSAIPRAEAVARLRRPGRLIPPF